MEVYVGRGRGVSTNVPELELIQQVKLRPLLFDKTVKDYRKSSASEQAWMDVANALQTTVTNCRKRWKSLRDTFIKYYRLDVISKSDSKRNRKNWVYYKDLAFLIPHVELYRLDDSTKSNDHRQPQNESVPINYLKEDYLDEKHLFYAEEEEHSANEEAVTYQIKISSKDQYEDEQHISEVIDDENILEGSYVEERLDDSTVLDIEEQADDNKAMPKLENDEHTYMVIEQSVDDMVPIQNTTKPEQPPSKKTENMEPTTSHRNIVDPDERYLLSCLPAFKRLTPKQKGLIRMGIEKLFFEIEFQDDDDEPRNKRSRNS